MASRLPLTVPASAVPAVLPVLQRYPDACLSAACQAAWGRWPGRTGIIRTLPGRPAVNWTRGAPSPKRVPGLANWTFALSAPCSSPARGRLRQEDRSDHVAAVHGPRGAPPRTWTGDASMQVARPPGVLVLVLVLVRHFECLYYECTPRIARLRLAVPPRVKHSYPLLADRPHRHTPCYSTVPYSFVCAGPGPSLPQDQGRRSREACLRGPVRAMHSTSTNPP